MRYISLCDDFYPLIEKKTKWMTYEQKSAYRVEHSIPGTIDQWISEGKRHIEAPAANPHKRGPTGKYPLWQDNVECILNTMAKKVSI